MNTSWFIAKRIAFNNKQSFSRFIIGLAVAATALSVAVMIVALSFVNGFQQTVSNKVFSFWGNIRVQQDIYERVSIAEEYPIDANKNVEDLLRNNPTVHWVQRFATRSAILTSKTEISSLLLKGIDQGFNFGGFNTFLRTGTWIQFPDSGYSYQVNISEKTARALQAKTGDTLVVFFLKEDGSKSARKLRVAGTFSTGIEKYDNNFALCDINLIRRLNQLDSSKIGGYEVFLKNYARTDDITKQIDQELPQSWYAKSIRQVYPEIFDWLGLQGRIKDILLRIMICVAAVNLITCLIILAIERTKMSGTLAALGMNDSSIRKIFLFHTAFISLGGILLGLALGLAICFLQAKTGFIKLNEDAYYMNKAEVIINWPQIFIVLLATFIICFLTLFITVALIRKINIVKAIQFR